MTPGISLLPTTAEAAAAGFLVMVVVAVVVQLEWGEEGGIMPQWILGSLEGGLLRVAVEGQGGEGMVWGPVAVQVPVAVVV